MRNVKIGATILAVLVCVFALTSCNSENGNTSAESPETSSSSSYVSVNTLEDDVSIPTHTTSSTEESSESTNDSPLASTLNTSESKPSTKYYSGTYENPIPYGTWTYADTELGETKLRISGVYRNSAIENLDEPMLYFMTAVFQNPDIISSEDYIPYAITYEIQAPSSFSDREYKPSLNFQVADIYGNVIGDCQNTSMSDVYNAGDVIRGSACCFLAADCLDTMPILRISESETVYFYGIDVEGDRNLFQ